VDPPNTAPQGPSPFLLALLISACAATGCATDQRSHPQTARLSQYCANRMYAERTSRGRSAVNWHIYDRCMQEHPEGAP